MTSRAANHKRRAKTKTHIYRRTSRRTVLWQSERAMKRIEACVVRGAVTAFWRVLEECRQ